MADNDPLDEAKRILASAGQAHLETLQRTPLFVAMAAFVDGDLSRIVEGINQIGVGADRQEQFAAVAWETTTALTLAEQIVANMHLFAVPALEASPPLAQVHDPPGEVAASPQPEAERSPPVTEKTEWPSVHEIEDFLAAQDELHELLGGGETLSTDNRALRRKLRASAIKDRSQGWTKTVLAERLECIDEEINRIRALLATKADATTKDAPADKFGETIPRSNGLRLLAAQQALGVACHDRGITNHALLQSLVTLDEIRTTSANWPSVAEVDRYTEDLLEAARQLPAKEVEPEVVVNDDPVQDRTWHYLTVTLLPQLTQLAATHLNGQHHLLIFETTAAARAKSTEQDVLAYIRQVEAAITPLRERVRDTRWSTHDEHADTREPVDEEKSSLIPLLLTAGVVVVGVLLLIIVVTVLSSGSGSTDALDNIRSLTK
ncbi:hypothetical protein CL628_02240 [bacterium]|nr:hypothetical protein [bacterium]